MIAKIILTISICLTLSISAFALADDNIRWANEMSNNAISTVWQNLKEQFAEATKLSANSDNEPVFKSSRLYVFVSHSMPKMLLKSYLEQAGRYGAVLVFKGLPNGSFQELSKLIIELTGHAVTNVISNIELLANLQIDQQAFEQFSVISVPTIVLLKDSEYSPSQNSELVYDKMNGNVGIKYALEQFSNSGELRQEAIEQLKMAKSDKGDQ